MPFVTFSNNPLLIQVVSPDKSGDRASIYLFIYLWKFQNMKERLYLWSYGESNPEPLACKASALPIEL